MTELGEQMKRVGVWTEVEGEEGIEGWMMGVGEQMEGVGGWGEVQQCERERTGVGRGTEGVKKE